MLYHSTRRVTKTSREGSAEKEVHHRREEAVGVGCCGRAFHGDRQIPNLILRVETVVRLKGRSLDLTSPRDLQEDGWVGDGESF